MSKLNRYLEFNWPTLVDECESHDTEDIAIHVMRRLDRRLGEKDVEIARLRVIEDETRRYAAMLVTDEDEQTAEDSLLAVLLNNPRPESLDA